MRAPTALQKLTYANVAATLAVVLSLGVGSAYAADLAKNSVKSKHIKNNTVSTKDIKDASLTAPDFAPDSLSGVQVNEGSLATVPTAASLVGFNPVGIARDGGHAVGAFSQGSPLTVHIAGFGSISLVCYNQGTASPTDDLIGYNYSLNIGPGARAGRRISFSSSPVATPELVMYNGTASGSGTTVDENLFINAEEYLTNATGSKAAMVRAWGWNDIATPGCYGAIEAQILR
jgi:hypothetical protein